MERAPMDRRGSDSTVNWKVRLLSDYSFTILTVGTDNNSWVPSSNTKGKT